MRKRDKKLLLFGIGLAVIIAIIAPFAASENPDGLESSAEEFESAEGKEDSKYESPMPDYIIPGLGDGENSGVAAIVIGTIVMLLLVLAIFYGLSYIKKARGQNGIEEKEGDEKDQ